MAPLSGQSDVGVSPNPRGAEVNRITLGFTITAGILVAFRIGIRAKRNLLGLDDFFIGIAMVFSVLLAASILMSVKHGFGRRTSEVPEHDIEMALFWWYLNQVFYKSITWPTKISILLLYRRVFLVVSNVKAYGVQFRYLLWGTFAIVVGCYISLETAGIFQCTPIRKSWNRSLPGYCTDKMKRLYAYACCNFLTDTIILLMPMPLISGMEHIPKRQRIGLMGIFALGGFVCVTILVRISKLNIGDDVLYTGLESVRWTTIEANVGILCACLPLMRSVIIYLLPWFDRRTNSLSSNRRRVGEEKSSGASWDSNAIQRPERANVTNEKDDPCVTASSGEEDTGSLSDSKIVIAEKVQESKDIETVAQSGCDDGKCESWATYNRRDPT